jgi:predicted regulator of Ras-like GTPase activity (Roadblock/LC7/MglB family)
MPDLPPLIEEDVQSLDSALETLLRKSEAAAAIIIDKGGPVIHHRGAGGQFDTTTIAALAAGSFCATAAIAGLLGEANFSSIYQQGERFSVLVSNVDDAVMLVVIFKADLSAGAVKYYTAETIREVAGQLRRARERSPGQRIELVGMNLADVSAVFGKKA